MRASFPIACVLLATWSASAAPADDPVVARVAGHVVTASEVRGRIDGEADAEAVRDALRDRVVEHLQAEEARTLLGDAVAGLSDGEAAERLVRHLFAPARVCANIPERLRRRLYRDTRWRFVAPPGWTVDDVQLLCCRDRRHCGDPRTVACIEAQQDEARAVRGALPDRTDARTFAERFADLAEGRDRLAFRRYTFFHDPGTPEGEVDGRLQEVDAPIAEAVAGLEPGEVAGPVVTRFGHHVLRLHARRDAVDLRWEDPRTQALLRTELCPEVLVTLRERYARDLARGAPVELRPEGLEEAFGVEVARALTATAPR